MRSGVICRHGALATLVGAILLLLPSSAAAQQPRIQSITPASLAFPTPVPADFDQGYLPFGQPVEVMVQGAGNRDWSLSILAESGTFDPTGKPVSDLEWSLDGATWTPLQLTAAPVAVGRGRQTLLIHFRLRLAWAGDLPGTYSVPIVVTVAYL